MPELDDFGQLLSFGVLKVTDDRNQVAVPSWAFRECVDLLQKRSCVLERGIQVVFHL